MGGTLTVTGLSAGYRNRPVLRELSLAPIEPGRVTALVGPNAAGKSTLLRSLAGLVPASGSIRLGDLDLGTLGLAERAGHVAFMPQTLPQNAELPARRVPRDWASARFCKLFQI